MEEFKAYLEDGSPPHLKDYQHESKFAILKYIFTFKDFKIM